MILTRIDPIAEKFSVGMGKIGEMIDKGYDNELKTLKNTSLLNRNEILNEIMEIYNDYSNENWDGNKAKPISNKTFFYAFNFLNTFIIGIPIPSLAPEGDDSIAFEWYKDVHNVLSVSIDNKGFLHYAALLGSTKRYGSEPLTDKMSSVILDLIKLINI